MATFAESVSARGRQCVDPRLLSSRLGINRPALSRIANLPAEILRRRPYSPLAQERLRQIVEIVSRAEDILGDQARAIAWFRLQPLGAFDHKTAEDLVAAGRGDAVRKHLDTLEHGGFS